MVGRAEEERVESLSSSSQSEPDIRLSIRTSRSPPELKPRISHSQQTVPPRCLNTDNFFINTNTYFYK